MESEKDCYSGFSGLIEKAVFKFLTRPVEPYADDIKDIVEAKQSDAWIDLDFLKKLLRIK